MAKTEVRLAAERYQAGMDEIVDAKVERFLKDGNFTSVTHRLFTQYSSKPNLFDEESLLIRKAFYEFAAMRLRSLVMGAKKVGIDTENLEGLRGITGAENELDPQYREISGVISMPFSRNGVSSYYSIVGYLLKVESTDEDGRLIEVPAEFRGEPLVYPAGFVGSKFSLYGTTMLRYAPSGLEDGPYADRNWVDCSGFTNMAEAAVKTAGVSVGPVTI